MFNICYYFTLDLELDFDSNNYIPFFKIIRSLLLGQYYFNKLEQNLNRKYLTIKGKNFEHNAIQV